MNMLHGIIAIFVLLGCAFLLSEDKKNIKWRTVGVGLVTQIVLIFFVVKIPLGQNVLEICANAVTKFISFGNEGLAFVFGDFATDNYSFAINVLALICFTSAIISLLYYLKVIPYLVKYVGGFISKIMGTSAPETFCAVGNSFLGGTEAPLLIKPFLSKLTRSELFAVMVAGFASASAGVIGGYALLGIPMKYLLIAMATVPFSSLMIAKIMIPETEENQLKNVGIEVSEANNVFEAIGTGAIQGMNVAISVGAVLIAFLGVVAVLDFILGLAGVTTSSLLGVLFTPLAWLFDIPQADAQAFASLIGIKTAMNEFVAFTDMGQIIKTLQPRTVAILAVALCNFANFSVIGIQVGAFKAFCPERAGDVSELGLRALIAGLVTTLITGSIVGMFF